MEGGLVLPLLLELLSQLEQALPPPVQHPQLRTGPALPPIRAFAGRGRISSPPCFFAGATQVERSSSTHTGRFTGSEEDTAADINTDGDGGARRVTRAARMHSVSCKRCKSRAGGEEQAEAAALTLAGNIHSPPHSDWKRRTEEVGERRLPEWQSSQPIPAQAF